MPRKHFFEQQRIAHRGAIGRGAGRPAATTGHMDRHRYVEPLGEREKVVHAHVRRAHPDTLQTDLTHHLEAAVGEQHFQPLQFGCINLGCRPRYRG